MSHDMEGETLDEKTMSTRERRRGSADMNVT